MSGVTFSGLSNIGGSGVGTTIAQLEGCTISNGGLELGCAYGLVKLVSCDLTYSAFNAGATASSNSAIDFIGSTYHAGATGSGLTFFSSIIGSDIVADCSDLSDIGNGSYYQYVADVTGGTICIARCKLSASSTAELFSTSISLPGIGKCHHSTATSPQFENALIVKDDAGHSAELTGDVYRSATSAKLPGGVQSVSLKLASSAITKDDIVASISPPIAGWCGTTNARRFVIECLIDSAALPTKNDVRLLLELPGDANSGLGVAYWSSGYTLSPEDVEESDAQWEGTSGMSNPTPFRLVVEAASALPGPFTAWVYLYKASTTIYVDPVVTDYAP